VAVRSFAGCRPRLGRAQRDELLQRQRVRKLRELLVVDVILRGHRVCDAAEYFLIPVSTAYDIVAHFVKTGRAGPLERAHGPAACYTKRELVALQRLSERENHLYLGKLRVALREETGLDASESTI
jgi:transposase